MKYTTPHPFIVRAICGAAGAMSMTLGLAPQSQAAQNQWFLQTGGVSKHSQETQATGRSWKEQHPGLGIERRSEGWGLHRSDWTFSSAGGLMQDSRGYWGAYMGSAYTRQWKLGRQVQADLGLGAYAFYRSTNWKGQMAWVPVVMPVGTVQLPQLGMSVNMAYVPRVSAINSAMPAVMFMQLGFRLP